MQTRLARGRRDEPPIDEAAASGEESSLHDQTVRWLRSNGIAFVHCQIGKKTTQTPGSPDFVIAAPNGRTLWIEYKTRTGKLSEDQRDWHFLATRAGHKVHVLRSMAEFHSLMSS